MALLSRRLSWLPGLCLLFQPVLLCAEPQTKFLDDLLNRARELQLASDPAWQNLLHYRPHVFGGTYSQADDEDFFLSGQGQDNAEAELEATLRALLDDKNMQCRFPARLHWLDSKLKYSHRLATVSCTEFEEWRDKLAMSAVTLIFPSMYLGNPASMFGHTFLRLDQKNRPVLLNYTLSYAARTDPDDSAIEYIYRGLAGGYNGVFAVQPYFETVQSYGDIEHRDIWEYSLNLSQAEVDQMVRHVWEIRSIQFDYYFLRENCSYRLLSLLEVARPGSVLTGKQRFPIYAAPVDTVRAAIDAGFVQGRNYRPAMASRIAQMHQQLDEGAQDLALQLVESTANKRGLDQFQPRQQAQILELAQEVREFKQQSASEDLLSARSRIHLEGQDSFVFQALSADQGHATARWQLAYGEENRQSFIELGIRPVFHDLLDQPDGFVKGAAISVLDARLRWFEERQEMELEALDLFKLLSLSPVEPWSTSVSVRLDLSVKQQATNTVAEASVFHMNSGLGLSAGWGEAIFYALANISLEHSGYYEKNHTGYLGAEAGILLPIGNSRMLMSAQSLNGVSGEKNSRQQYLWGFQFNLHPDHGLRLNYELTRYDWLENKSLGLSYLMYF